MKQFKGWLFSCIAVLFLGLAGHSVPAASKMVLHRGNGAEPGTLDPLKASGAWEDNIIGDLFMGLTTEDAAGKAVPGCARSWDVSADGRTYVFHLRDDIFWTDGTPVTAQDFVYAFHRLLNPATAAQYASMLFILVNGEAVSKGQAAPETLGARALDARTLELKLVSPVPYLIQLLTHYATFPVPRQAIEKYGSSWTMPGHMISNGAYKLAAWKPQSYVKLVKNPGFYDAANVKIDEVYFYPTEDGNSALKQFRAGELDITDGFPARQLDWLRRNMPQDVHISPWLGTYYYALNTQKYPFTDKRVRLALSMAVERKLITSKLLGYGVVPAYGFVPPGIANYGKGAKVFFYNWSSAKRRAEARRLLAEAGFGPDHPLELTISYNTSQDHKKIALAVASNWKKIGVIAHLFNVEAKVQFANMRVGNFEVGRASWVADFNDPRNFLFLLDSKTGALNYGRYHNKKYDHLLEQASLTLDLKKRARILQSAEQIAMDDQPVIPIYYYVARSLVSQRVHGWIDNIANKHRTRYLWLSPSVHDAAGETH